MSWFRRLFDWRVEALIRNEDGSPVNLSLTEDGKLKTETNINIDSVTATDVTIKDATDGNKKLVVNSDGSLNMQLTGSNMEYFGATIDDRPAANSVPVGAVYMAVDTDEVWQSNGTSWVVK